MRINNILGAAAIVCTAFAPVAIAQPEAPDRALVGSLPASCDLVIATGDLAPLRQSPAWRCAEQFLGEMATWQRSLEAWSQVASSLGMTPREAADEVLGSRLIFTISGLSDPSPDRRPQHALITEISPDIERRLRERLKPAPREVEGGLPILALENGAFDLATSLRESEPKARVLISPRGSSALFDSLLPVIRAQVRGETLEESTAWTQAADLPTGRAFVLYRDLHPDARAATERFIAATVTPRADVLTADILASRELVLRTHTPAPGDPLPTASPAAWPAGGVEWLARDAALLIAGSPREQPLDLDLDVPSGHVRGTLLHSLLDMLRLPDGLQRRIDGVAVIAVHEPRTGDGAPEPGAISITAAIPVDDVSTFAPDADAWTVTLSGDPEMKAPRATLDSIRLLSLTPKGPGVLAGFVKPGGSLAWGYVRHPGADSGWWVLNIRTGVEQDEMAVSTVNELSVRLSRPLDADDSTLFQLSLDPARLAALKRAAAGDRVPADTLIDAPPDPLDAFRWIQRVETRLQRAPAGLARGTVKITFNTSLLDPPRPAGR
ncbi:hypothetical protein PHYC_01493 [Phycisphaerales bacterium]|nr:hypothetical protein PHYC_01493 [Phycisphaerales bacterium]